jgi:hypothetical protein
MVFSQLVRDARVLERHVGKGHSPRRDHEANGRAGVTKCHQEVRAVARTNEIHREQVARVPVLGRDQHDRTRTDIEHLVCLEIAAPWKFRLRRRFHSPQRLNVRNTANAPIGMQPKR